MASKQTVMCRLCGVAVVNCDGLTLSFQTFNSINSAFIIIGMCSISQLMVNGKLTHIYIASDSEMWWSRGIKEH